MITHQDKISILLTFSVGFVAGVYFYFTGISFEFTSDIPEEDFYEDFVVEGQAYGICEIKGCLSFQLLADGSYRLILPNSNSGEITKNGVINLALRNELMKNLDDKSLTKQSKTSLSNNCASDDDGTDYNFVIIKNKKEYELDTCGTSIDFDSQSWLSLAKLWNYFEAL
jgi:hypothetical protein